MDKSAEIIKNNTNFFARNTRVGGYIFMRFEGGSSLAAGCPFKHPFAAILRMSGMFHGKYMD